MNDCEKFEKMQKQTELYKKFLNISGKLNCDAIVTQNNLLKIHPNGSFQTNLMQYLCFISQFISSFVLLLLCTEYEW